MSLEEILEDIRDTCYMHLDRIDVDTRQPDGDQPIHIAVIQQRFDYISVLLANGADPNALGDMGETPLHHAVARGQRDIVELLLNNGASPLIVSEFGHTALDLVKDPAIRAMLLIGKNP